METINKKNETTGTVIIPKADEVLDITIEGQDAIIKGIDESIGNFTNQIALLEEKKAIEVARKDGLIAKGVITETEKKETERIEAERVAEEERLAKEAEEALLKEEVITKK